MRSQRNIVIAAVVLLVSGLASCRRRAPTEDQAAEYKAEAEPIIEALETHYPKHGTYPATVEETDMTHFDTPYGSSRYEVYKNGQMCQLIIGAPATGPDFNLHWTGVGRDSHKFPQKWSWVVYP